MRKQTEKNDQVILYINTFFIDQTPVVFKLFSILNYYRKLNNAQRPHGDLDWQVYTHL